MASSARAAMKPGFAMGSEFVQVNCSPRRSMTQGRATLQFVTTQLWRGCLAVRLRISVEAPFRSSVFESLDESTPRIDRATN